MSGDQTLGRKPHPANFRHAIPSDSRVEQLRRTLALTNHIDVIKDASFPVFRV